MTENNHNFDRIMAMQQALMAQEISMRDSLGTNLERTGWEYCPPERRNEIQTMEEEMRYFQEAMQDYLHNYRMGIGPYRFNGSMGTCDEPPIQDDDQIIF